MNRTKIRKQFIDILEEEFQLRNREPIIDRDSFMDDLGLDSLDCVELLMAVEEKFDIEVSDEKAETAITVGDGLNLIEELLDK